MPHQFFPWVFVTFIILVYSGYTTGQPEYKDCKFMKDNETIVRIRDVGYECHKFYYCTHALAKPYPTTCPHDDRGDPYIWTYFNPNTSSCGFERDWRCYDHREGTPSGVTAVYVPRPTTTSTTTPRPTTTRAPRPPPYVDVNPLIIDCSKTPCGLFPNRYGSCDSYVMCVNGENVTKHCNQGQLFDVKTKECQPKNKASCWTEPNAGPHVRKTESCPFHGKNSSTPVEVLEDGIVLQNPEVTNWGEWQDWVMCPEGKYAVGINAFRKLRTEGSKKDFAGIVALSYLCRSPEVDDDATDDVIESFAPNLPHDGWPMHFMCKGAIVGFRLNSAGPLADNVATDNVQAICSCSDPVMKPYDQAIYAPQNGHRGDWTESQICRKGQAVCGMQTQMQEYKEQEWGKWDNTGLNNFRVKCCDVPNPLDTCRTSEIRLPVRTCDNSKSEDEDLRCDFESGVGLSLLYETKNPLYAKLVDFYTSIGYTMDDAKAKLPKKIETELLKQMRADDGRLPLEYPWDEPVPEMFKEETFTSRKVWVAPGSEVELFQIVGRCGYFLVKTNRFVKEEFDKDGRFVTTFFEV